MPSHSHYEEDYRDRSHRGGRDDEDRYSESGPRRHSQGRQERDYDYDDDYRGGGSGRYGRNMQSRSDRSDRGYSEERGHGGWFGDSEGHSEASRRGWQHSDHEGSGWYGDSRGHSEAARRGWDNPDHAPSGWFGDPEGHSEASRRGWEHSDHEGSGWYGDSEGHSRAARSRGRGGYRGEYEDRYDRYERGPVRSRSRGRYD